MYPFTRVHQSVEKPITFLKWGLGRSLKRGEGGSPTLSPFPRGRGLGIGIENLLYFIKTYFFYKLLCTRLHGYIFLSPLYKKSHAHYLWACCFLLKSSLCLFNKSSETCGVVDSNFRQHLSVKTDVSLL